MFGYCGWGPAQGRTYLVLCNVKLLFGVIVGDRYASQTGAVAFINIASVRYFPFNNVNIFGKRSKICHFSTTLQFIKGTFSCII